MLEHCEHCHAYAPSWADPSYAEWHVGLTAEGIYIGVVCPACFIDEELAFVGRELVTPADAVQASVDQLEHRRRAPRARRTRRAARSATQPTTRAA